MRKRLLLVYRGLSPYALVLGIIGVIAFAALMPGLGSDSSPLPISILKDAGIFMIFFNQGVLLPGEALRRGVKDWQLHTLIQCYLFIFIPLITAALLWLTRDLFVQPDLRMGFLFLSFLPTTVATAVGLTTLSHGNVTGALFNCTLSAVMGTILVPLYGLKWLQSGAAESGIHLGETLQGICLIIILPLILGQCLRPKLEQRFRHHRIAVNRFNSGVILFIVWASFCSSFELQVWSRVSTVDLLICFLGVSVLLFISSLLIWKLSGFIALDPASKITAFFCGSQKSLSIGLPLSALMFGSTDSSVNLSLLVIPLLIYHPAQMVLGGWLVPRFARTLQPMK
ncbi:bile acid:sodium symporter [Kiritimatiellaeota bacterium B1221]|nr:bile acid:sodium symporter [Kiritimatiellaeota bacterium B1221]